MVILGGWAFSYERGTPVNPKSIKLESDAGERHFTTLRSPTNRLLIWIAPIAQGPRALPPLQTGNTGQGNLALRTTHAGHRFQAHHARALEEAAKSQSPLRGSSLQKSRVSDVRRPKRAAPSSSLNAKSAHAWDPFQS